MRKPTRLRGGIAVAAVGIAAAASALAVPASASASTAAKSATAAFAPDDTGLPAGSIKHVWLIIEENKSYDATFTGLNKNSYLWQTLPQQGALLKNYYGTGHFSQDNYEALVAGQAPEIDTQSDCDVAATNFSSNALTSFTGDVSSNSNFGQAASAAGPNAKDGKNGCVYPTAAPTLFNQFDAAGITWKGYAQDLGDQPGRDDGVCGYPGTSSNTPDGTVDPGATSNTAYTSSTVHSDSTALNAPKAYKGVQSFTGVQAAGTDGAGNPSAEDGYVAKHFPFPWFHALTDQNVTTPVGGGTDCDNNHIANLDGPPSATSPYQGSGLVQDLQSEATTPNFSWITPNNCSDAHDAVCKGNNLSGAFNADGTPNYNSGVRQYDPQGTTPVNYTGGLYASDLFLKWYVPLIEQSPAFKDGGLIDITFDEGNPPFANSSFNNANDPNFAANQTNTPDGADGNTSLLHQYLTADAAGENINGTNVSTEPTGPNTPFVQNSASSTNPTDANSTCPSTQPSTQPCPGPGDNGFIDRTPSGGRTDSGATAPAGTSTISDNSILAPDAGRSVSGTGIPANAFVGSPSDTGPTNTPKGGSAITGSFTLVDAGGNALQTTGAVSGVTLGAETASTDPIYDVTDQTPGGGDTGSVLISPFIKPGTTTTTYYNHYSWLRTMEDIFNVKTGTATSPLVSGTTASISGGLDGLGHLGYASQPGLKAFGSDIFNNPSGVTAPPAALGESGLAVGLPIAALIAGAGAFMVRRRRTAGTAGQVA